eukprot:1085202-Pleurochrysis_carterae.AAC.1
MRNAPSANARGVRMRAPSLRHNASCMRAQRACEARPAQTHAVCVRERRPFAPTRRASARSAHAKRAHRKRTRRACASAVPSPLRV